MVFLVHLVGGFQGLIFSLIYWWVGQGRRSLMYLVRYCYLDWQQKSYPDRWTNYSCSQSETIDTCNRMLTHMIQKGKVSLNAIQFEGCTMY